MVNKMKKLLLLLLCFSLHAMAEPKFQLHPSEPGSDGPTARFVTFKNGNHEIRYVPPAKWSVSADRFQPEEREMAAARIEMFPISPALGWDKEHEKTVREWVMAHFVPKESSNLAFTPETADSLKICGLDSHEIVFTFWLFGMTYQTGVVVVESDNTRFCFILGAQKKDFNELYQAFLGSLYSVDGI